MATDPLETVYQATPPEAPLSGTRSQAMQRLQIGLFGLAAMILLVSLANIILTNAQQNEARVVPEAAPTVAADVKSAPVRDPLADAGVVPDMPDMPDQAEAEAADAAPALQP